MQAALLQQLPCCSLPRALTCVTASTSISVARPCLVAEPRQHKRSRSCSHIVHITGKREEYKIEGIADPEDIWGEDADPEFIEVDTMPIWEPERGPVFGRVFRDAEEEKETKQISIEDTAYWFADSNPGERTTVFPTAPIEEGKHADEELKLPDVEGLPPRLRLADLEEGDELVGIVTDQWLWHGAFVDVMAEFKGLVPIRQSEWEDVQEHLLPGTEVVVRVHKLSEYPKYRFPIQLELLEPAEIPSLITAPTDYDVPANVGWCFEQGWDITQVAKELGRHYKPVTAIEEPDQAEWMDRLDYAFGYDAPDGHAYPKDWITREILEEPAMMDELSVEQGLS